jgi:hypothetical protein
MPLSNTSNAGMIPKCELQEHVQLCHPFILDFSFIYERSLGFYGHLQMLERVTNSNFANICTTHIFTPLHDFQLKIVETEYSHLVFLLLLYPEGSERTKWILGFIVISLFVMLSLPWMEVVLIIAILCRFHNCGRFAIAGVPSQFLFYKSWDLLNYAAKRRRYAMQFAALCAQVAHSSLENF